MPRGGSRGRGGGSRSPPPRSSYTASRPMPPPQQPKTMPTHQSGGMLGGIGSTIMTGMAFGAGSEVAHQAVRGMMGGGPVTHQVADQAQQYNQQPQQYNQQPQQYQNPCQF